MISMNQYQQVSTDTKTNTHDITNKWAMGMLIFKDQNYQFCWRKPTVICLIDTNIIDEFDTTSMYRNNDLPITTGTRLILTDPRLPFDKKTILIMFISLCASRFNVELDKETSTFILRIRDIQETDGATYQCQVLFFDLPKNCLAMIKMRVVIW